VAVGYKEEGAGVEGEEGREVVVGRQAREGGRARKRDGRPTRGAVL